MIVFCCFLFFVCFYVVMLLIKLEAGKQKLGGAKSGKTVRQNQKGATVFAILENIRVFVFGFLCFYVFLQKHNKNRGFNLSVIIIFGFWGATSRVNK